MASWSRGGWLGVGAGVGIVIVFRSRRALIISVGLALMLVGAAALGAVNPQWMPPALSDRLADIPAYVGLGIDEVINQPVTDENFSVIERLAHWLAAWRMWERSPWLGIGPGNYAAVYPAVRLPLWEDPLGHAHNIYLNVLAETGLIGLTAYGLLWAFVIAWVWRQARHSPPQSWRGALAIGILGMIAHLSVHQFFDNLFVQGIYIHLALGLAALAAHE